MVKDRKAQANAPGGAVPWNVVVSVAEVPPTGRHVELKPDATTREAIAKRAGVLEVPQLEATFELAPHGSEGLRVSGRVVGSVVQSCVVTLEPVTNEIDEEVDLLFMPPREPPKATEPSSRPTLPPVAPSCPQFRPALGMIQPPAELARVPAREWGTTAQLFAEGMVQSFRS